MTWPFTPRKRVTISVWKPLMTEVTTINVATPSAMPISEKIAMIDTNRSPLRARKYRPATARSNAPNMDAVRPGWPADAGQRVLGTEFHPLPGRAAFQFDLAGGGAARPDDELPRMAHQIGVVEFDAGAVLAIVVQRVAAERFVQLRAQRVAGGVANFQIQDRGAERRDRSPAR